MYQNVINFNRAKKEESLPYYLVSVILYQTIHDNWKYAGERRVGKIIATERKNRSSLDDDKIHSRYRKRVSRDAGEGNRRRRVIKGVREARFAIVKISLGRGNST